LAPTAAVYGDVLPLIEVPVSVKALVWCPEKGGLIQGVLVHKGADFIAARVLGLWNAVIVKSHCNYLDKSKVNEGDAIRFRIQEYVPLSSCSMPLFSFSSILTAFLLLSLQIVNNLLSIEGTLLGEDVGVLDESGNMHFPKVSTAAISLPPVVSVTNPKKRPRADELSTAATQSTTSKPVSSPVIDAATAAKKRKLKEEETGEVVKSPTKKDKKDKKDKKERHKDKKEKHKDKSK